MTRRFVGDVREVVALAWPTVLTMVSYTLMQFVDAVMVAQVGPLELRANLVLLRRAVAREHVRGAACGRGSRP